MSHKLGLSLHLIYFTFLLSVTRSSSFILYFSRLHFNTATTMDHYLPGMAVSTLHVPKSMTQTLTKTGTGRACGRSSRTQCGCERPTGRLYGYNRAARFYQRLLLTSSRSENNVALLAVSSRTWLAWLHIPVLQSFPFPQ